MQDQITELYYSREPICGDGRAFLAGRGLSLDVAHKAGVCSKDGKIYFLFFRNGEVVRWKARSMADKKIQFMSKLEVGMEMDFKMPFFCHFPASTTKDLLITEGEFDSIALRALKASNCVSLPNGAGSVESSFRNNYEYLQQFDRIFIAFDMDKPGEEAARKAMSMISPSKYRRIVFPCKDANEWVEEYQPTPEDLQELMANAKRVETPCITSFFNLPDSYYEAVDVGVSTGFKGLDNILLGLRRQEVTVISADTGAGKSTFCLNLMKNLAEKGAGVWINSYEMNPKMVNRKMASIVLRKNLKLDDLSYKEKEEYKTWCYRNNCYLNVTNSPVDLAALRSQFEMASLAFGIKFILLDHLDYIHSNGTKKTSLENIDDAVRGIHSLAMEFNVGVLLVVHPKQVDRQELAMSDLKGSSSIKQYADNILLLTRMDRIDENDKLRVKIKVCKNRLLGKEGSFSLRYIPEIDGYTEGF